MKQRIIDIGLSLLFAITLIITIFCLTVLNKNFVVHSMDGENYYLKVYESIKKDFDARGLSYELTEDKVKEDIRVYVKNRYRNDYYRFSNQELRDDYNKYIKFNNYFKDFDICSIVYLIYLLDLVLIITTGCLFLKTKGIHSLNIIVISNFIVVFLLYGILTLFIDCNNDMINIVITKFSHYYLATAIILLEINIFSQIKARLKK